MSTRFDLLIIGGGVIGLSCAIQALQRRANLRVAILSQAAQAGMASVAAAGMLAPFSEFEEDGPLFQLCLRSFRIWPKFAKDCAPGTELKNCGTLRIPREDDAPTPASLMLAYQNDYQFAEFAGEYLRAMEPALSHTIFKAQRLPEKLVNTRVLHAKMLEKAHALGVEFVEGMPASLLRNGPRIASIVLSDRTLLDAESIVLATGAWSQPLGEAFGVSIPMIPMKGQVTSLTTRPGLLKHMISAKGIYLAPRDENEVLVGATMEAVGFDLSLDPAAETAFVLKAAALVPELAEATINSTWVGFRPRTPDGMPVIGRAAPDSNVWVASGHFRNGILLTPITGKLIADSLFGESEPPPEFRVARFA